RSLLRRPWEQTVMTLKEIREAAAKKIADMRKVNDAINDGEGRAMTAEERAKIETLSKEYDDLKARADALEKQERAERELQEPRNPGNVGRDNFDGRKVEGDENETPLT